MMDYKDLIEDKIYFISGHLDLTNEEFMMHYAQQLLDAVNEGAAFVVGDANGADSMAQEFLVGRTDSVAVYHMLESPRNNHGFKVIGGYRCDKERDEAMTKASSADIAWVRPGREKSGTAKNIKRRTCL